MPTIDVSIDIDQPRERVFDAIVDPDSQPLWQSGLLEYEALYEGAPQKGGRTRGVTKAAGRKIEWVGEFTEVDRPSRVAGRTVESPFPFEFSYTLTEADGATHVAYHGESGSLGGFFGKLGDPIVAKMYERDMKANLANLKAIIEES